MHSHYAVWFHDASAYVSGLTAGQLQNMDLSQAEKHPIEWDDEKVKESDETCIVTACNSMIEEHVIQ